MTGGSFCAGQAHLPSPHPTESFWLHEPSPVLLGHRSTPELPRSADVVIVGSGISGAFAAWYLLGECRRREAAGARKNVVMLEAREVCSGATGRNGGHCQPQLYQSSLETSRFELANWEHIRSLVAEHGIPCEWRKVEICHAYCDVSMWKTAVASVEALKAADPELGGSIRLEKSISDGSPLRLNDKRVVGAITGQKAASLSPYKLIAWIVERLLATYEDDTFNLQTNSPVTRLQRLRKGAWIIHTPRGMIEAKQVLLATNAYTSYLLPKFSDLIVPVRGEMSALIPPPSVSLGSGLPLSGRNSYVFWGQAGPSFSGSNYLIQRPFCRNEDGDIIGGELMFGGGREHAPSWGIGQSDDGDIDQPVADYLRSALNKVLKLENEEAELKATHEWSGIMGYSKDRRPWVGQVPEGVGGGSGLWICAGFTGHGMPNACLSAKCVADMMLGREMSGTKLPNEFIISPQRVAAAMLL